MTKTLIEITAFSILASVIVMPMTTLILLKLLGYFEKDEKDEAD